MVEHNCNGGANTVSPTPGCTLATLDTLNAASAQLEALLQMISGGGATAFFDLNDELKAHYLWAAADLGKRVRALAWSLSVGRGHAAAETAHE